MAPEDAKGPKQPSKAPRTQKGRKWPIWALVVALVVIIGGTTMFVGATAGWFSQSVTLDPEYLAGDTSLANSDGEFLELLTPERYNELTSQKKSFVVFIDQVNCTNANRMRGFVTDYEKETGIKAYRMMFSEMKQTALYEKVKYYPSVAIIEDGTPVAWLEADSDQDGPAYNDYMAFQAWMNEILR